MKMYGASRKENLLGAPGGGVAGVAGGSFTSVWSRNRLNEWQPVVQATAIPDSRARACRRCGQAACVALMSPSPTDDGTIPAGTGKGGLYGALPRGTRRKAIV